MKIQYIYNYRLESPKRQIWSGMYISGVPVITQEEWVRAHKFIANSGGACFEESVLGLTFLHKTIDREVV